MRLKEKKLKFCITHANIYEEVLTEAPIGTIVYIVERVSTEECQICHGRTEVSRQLIEGKDP